MTRLQQCFSFPFASDVQFIAAELKNLKCLNISEQIILYCTVIPRINFCMITMHLESNKLEYNKSYCKQYPLEIYLKQLQVVT